MKMKIIISLLLSLVFFCIAAIHFYWAFGGKLFLNAAIPTNEKSEAKVFSPSPLATLFVALIFCALGIFVLLKAGLVLFPLLLWMSNYGLGFIAFVFFVRAIGDFKYAGFFKKTTNTLFAKMDTKYYSPLCLAVAVLTVLLILFK
jgi:glucan phosphoethanolaminetransferase (alkaline phosphatase superfamily)